MNTEKNTVSEHLDNHNKILIEIQFLKAWRLRSDMYQPEIGVPRTYIPCQLLLNMIQENWKMPASALMYGRVEALSVKANSPTSVTSCVHINSQVIRSERFRN